MNKNIKLTLLALITPLIFDMMIACKTEHSPGGYYSTKSFSLNNLDNSVSAPFITTSDSVLKRAYGIDMHLIRDQVGFINNTHPFLSQSAYAYDPSVDIGLSFPVDSIVSIQIFTIYDFDSSHPASSEITDYFKVYQNYSFTAVKDYFNSLNQLFPLSDLQLDIELLLMTAPTMNTKHQFEIKITISDGRILEQETTPINLI